ncbi:hypothetical protein [Silvibacterium acidisoli]|uniref:hypothetical protein n=1 Tax=Acidobacteriaceae bacterium ZG23-2 TaxID=2883246 RepID=UPI00406C66D2
MTRTTKKPERISDFIYTPAERMETVEEYVAYSIKAREEAHAEAVAEGFGEKDADEVANMSWRCVLPIMSSRLAVQSFIACVAVGAARGWIKAEEARGLSYTAQLGMAALREAR